MKNSKLKSLLLLALFVPPLFAGTLHLADPDKLKNKIDAIAELTVTANEQSTSICSSFIQNCTVNIGTTGCVNPPGSITVTNNSTINARNITASSTNANFLNYVLQNNGCPAILGPKASCSISFTSSTINAFLIPDVITKGTNTNTTYFNINALQCDTGTLIPIPGSPFVTQPLPNDLAATPNSKFLYVSNSGTDSVAGYAINQITGVLTPLSGSPFSAGNNPSAVAVSPNGQFVYVTNASDDNVSGYQVNQTTGNLTPIVGSPFAAGSTPANIAITPNGNFIYVSNQNGNNISAYAINSSTGALTQIPGSPFVSPYPTGITTTPDGAFLYVADRDPFGFDGYVYGYAINSTTGSLTSIVGNPFITGTYPDSVVSNSAGTFIYVAAGNGPGFKKNAFDNSIWIYSVNQSTGELTDVTPVPPMSMVSASDIALTPNDKYAYTTHYSDNTVLGDIIEMTGVLTLMSTNPFATENGPNAIIVTPNGSFVYVVNYNNSSISGYTIN